MDPTGGILYYGDGRIRRVPQKRLEESSLAGLQGIDRVAAAMPDGSVCFYGEFGNGWYIFRRNPGGGYELVTASRQTPGVVVPVIEGWGKIDGLPVDRVSLDGGVVWSMSGGPDGSLYVSDGSVIARLAPDGIWHVILGGGLDRLAIHVLQPDGTPAAQSFTSWSGGSLLAVGPDSSVYFTASWPYYAPNANGTNYTMVRKIAPDGRLYTVFGGGGVANNQLSPTWKTLFGTAAYGAHYVCGNGVGGLAVGNDGTVYVAEQDGTSSGIFKISPGGVIFPFLNGAPICSEGLQNPNSGDPNITAQIQGDQGKQATNVVNYWAGPTSLVAAQDGSVYFADGNMFVWRVNPNGVLERIAGRFTQSALPSANLPLDGGDPLNTTVYPVDAMALTADDSLFLVNTSFSNPGITPIYIIPGRSSPNGTLVPISSQSIPSEDGTEVFVFDSVGKHLETLDSLTGATKWTFGYDANSLVVTMTDLAGNVTRIERDASGQPTAIVGPYGQRTSLAMDANGFLSAVTNPAHETTSLTNSAGGLLQGITGPQGETYTVAYDGLGRVTNVADPLGGGWTDSASDKGVLPDYSYEVDVNCTNSLGDTLTRRMFLNPSGDTTIYSSLGGYPIETAISRLTGASSSSLSDGTTLFTGMGPDPRFGNQAMQPVLSTLTFPNGVVYKASVQRTVGLTNSTDPFSLTGLTNVTTVNGKSYASTYDPSNRTVTIVSPAGRTNSAAGDALGRVVHVTSPGHPVLDLVYDASGRLATVTGTSSAGLAQATLSYDTLGQLSAVTDPLGRTNAFSYDAAGRLKQATLPDGSVIGITLDSEDNLTSLTPPGRPAHTFQYNPVGLLTQYTPPPVGSDDSVGYQYDSERNLTLAAFPDGQIVTIRRGLAGRPEQMTLGAGPTFTYQYGTHYDSDLLWPTNITSTTGDSLQLGYVGSLLTSVAWSGSITGQVSIQFNSDLLPASQSVGASAIAYTYDADRLLTNAGALALTRDPASGFVMGTSLGGVTDQRQFDDRGLLTNYVASVNGASIWSVMLGHDLIGRLTNRVETLGGVTTTFGYVYDLAGRLEQVWQNGAVVTTYTYDVNGNRLSRNTETATYDAQDRVQTYAGTTFGWSPNGDLRTSTTGGQATTYTYDARGALTTVALPDGREVDYLIEAGGRRIGKRIAGNLVQGFLYASLSVVAELDGAGQVASRFVYASKPNVPDYMVKGTNTYRLISDERGSVRLVVNIADGSIVQQLDYDEFGRVLTDTGPGFQPFGFAGGLYDADTGLVRFGFRDYSARTGQWTARDPIGFQGGQLSFFSYLDNDPLNFIDPAGLGPWNKLSDYANSIPHIYHELADLAAEMGLTVGVAWTLEKAGQETISVGNHLMEIAHDVGVLGGGLIDRLSGDLLGRANREAKGIDLSSGNSKKNPFNNLDPRSGGW